MNTGDQSHANVVIRPPLLYLGALVFGVSLEAVWPLGAGLFASPWREGIIAIVLVISGSVLLGLATGCFRKAGTNIPTVMPTLVLVTSGPYAWSRNPIYIGLTLIYTGLALALNAWWAVVFLPGVLGILRYGVIAREEVYLAARFPDQYPAYCARVRRWI